MSPIDGKTQQLVYTEFAKDRQSAERDRKEQVRKEIHDSKVVMKTKSVKKFKIMSVEDQRKSEKKKAEAPIKEEKESKKAELKKEAPVLKKPKKIAVQPLNPGKSQTCLNLFFLNMFL